MNTAISYCCFDGDDNGVSDHNHDYHDHHHKGDHDYYAHRDHVYEY